ncbi:hypothetical protein [Mycolicibacterium sp.]|uniref:hypothetical protein n=1 Tax=Mycolicibacterium sp. TaxID=2320850 RepID=UPI003D150DE6
MTALRRQPWLWALLAAVVVVGSVVIVWATRDSGPSPADCAVVEDVAREWNTTSAAVRDTLLNGGGRPDDYRGVADRQAEMAKKLRSAADSVSAPELETQLGKWAGDAERYAALQRQAADRAPGTPPPSDTEFQDVARSMNDAAVALSQQCPGMPSAER